MRIGGRWERSGVDIRTRSRRTKEGVLNCCGKMPCLRKARLPGSCNLPQQLGIFLSRRRAPSGVRRNGSTRKMFGTPTCTAASSAVPSSFETW